MWIEAGLTYGYGESGFENPGSESALTSVLVTELISWGGSADASSFGLATASAFCWVLSAVAGSGLASAGAGRALLVPEYGKRATPICWIFRQLSINLLSLREKTIWLGF